MCLRLLLVGFSIVVRSAAVSSPVHLLPKRTLHCNRSLNRPSMQRGYADGPFGQVHYRDTGGEGTPVVLLPMAPGSSRTFERILPEFKRIGVRAIAVDPPGVGMSDAAPSFLTIEEQVPSITAVLDHLTLKECDVFGIKTGAKLAAAMSVRCGSRVRKAVLVDPLPETPEDITDANAKLTSGTLGFEVGFYVGNIDEEDGDMHPWFWRPNVRDNELALRFVSDVFSAEAAEAHVGWPDMSAKCFDLRAAMLSMKQPTLILQIPASYLEEGDVDPRRLAARNLRSDWECVELSPCDFELECLEDGAELVAAVHTFLQK